MEGSILGSLVGLPLDEGFNEGSELGSLDLDGLKLVLEDGTLEGFILGSLEGSALGSLVGMPLFEGFNEGSEDGAADFDGSKLGSDEG